MRDRFRSRDKTVFFFMIILVAILLLGIGYAFVKTFSHSEKKEEKESFNVVFTDYKTSGSGDINASIDLIHPEKAYFSISNLKGYGDTSIIEYTMENKEEEPLRLEIRKSKLSNNTYFTIESNIEELNQTVIQPKEKKILRIKVKVVKVYIDEENKTIDAKANIAIQAKRIK